MFDLSCLRDSGVATPSSGDLFGWIVGIVFLGLVTAAIASPVVRARYRARVTRLMALEQVQPRPAAWWQRAHRRDDDLAVSAPAPSRPDAAALRARAAEVERRLTRATLIAWLVFALFAAAVAGVLGQSQSFAMRLADGVVAALFAVGPVLANLPRPRWSRRALLLGAVALVGGGVLGTAIDPVGGDSAGDIALGAVVLAAIYVALLHRSLRGQILPLLIVCVGAMLVLFVPALMLDASIDACIIFTTGGATR